MGLKDTLGSAASSTGSALNYLDKQVESLNKANNPLTEGQIDQFKSDGFLLPSTFSADGSTLPFSKVPPFRDSSFKRNIITWFVPEFGTVRMFVNPQQITYNHKKLIQKDRTKGGYTLQYWGEELSTINLSGTTGSSGVEGINVLYEVYRAEQYAFDAVGLTLAANNSAADLASNAVNAVGGALGGALFGGDAAGEAAGAGLLGGLLGLDSPNNQLAAQNMNSLAQLAFTVEMFYAGNVYRGYFENMTVTEKANDFLLDYSLSFVVTQRRGYRTNRFGWEKSAKDGPSSYTTPHSYSGKIK